MAKGNPIVPLRLNPKLIAIVDAAIASANVVRKEEPYTRSSWIKEAIRQKLSHLDRSKRKGRKV